ncbi:MAG: hypothetical protein JWN76_1703 [Chitinophagaceae bacterium]|nr:hypothetical protein [Chitinophagaceae bacterium]
MMVLVISTNAFSQKTDTVFVDASKINTNILKPGVNRYVVYFKNGKDSSRISYSMWTRTIDFIKYRGRDAISIRQYWEGKDSVYHRVYSVNDRKTFAPLFHETWWGASGSFVFDLLDKKATVRNQELSDTFTNPGMKKIWDAYKVATNGQYILNWHLDLETFPLLPYKENTTFMINFYDPGFPAPQQVAYTVSGSAILPGYNDQQIECWLLTHTSGNTKETFWISKKTKEVLQLEDEFNGRYRYKIKLPYSM